MEINIIKSIQSAANSFWDSFFLLTTHMGSGVFIVAVFCLLFWCYNKRYAFNFGLGCGVAVLFNYALKTKFNRPRPFVTDHSIINYTNSLSSSFPSGHSATIGAVSSLLLSEVYAKRKSNKKWFRITSIVVVTIACLLVAFSRMYLGQHYLSDVIIGLAVGWGAGTLFYKFGFIKNDKEHSYALYLLPILFAVPFLYVDEMFTTILKHKTIFMYVGILTSVIIGYYFEKKYVKFDPQAGVLFTIFKIAFGVLSTYGLYLLLGLIFPNILFFYMLQTFITGLWATLGIMAFFKWFKTLMKIDQPKQEPNSTEQDDLQTKTQSTENKEEIVEEKPSKKVSSAKPIQKADAKPKSSTKPKSTATQKTNTKSKVSNKQSQTKKSTKQKTQVKGK